MLRTVFFISKELRSFEIKKALRGARCGGAADIAGAKRQSAGEKVKKGDSFYGKNFIYI